MPGLLADENADKYPVRCKIVFHRLIRQFHRRTVKRDSIGIPACSSSRASVREATISRPLRVMPPSRFWPHSGALLFMGFCMGFNSFRSASPLN